MSLICELLELLKREPLTKAEFEYKLFSEGDEQVLKSIMRKDGQRALLKNLKELIKEYNIQTIDALEQLKSDLLRESDSREFCKKYGIDYSPIEFTFHQGFYFLFNAANELNDQYPNDRNLIAYFTYRLSSQQQKAFEPVTNMLEIAKLAEDKIEGDCQLLEQGGNQPKAIKTFKEKAIKAVYKYVESTLAGPEHSNKAREEYQQSIKNCSEECKAALDDSSCERLRKVLKVLVNFLTHISLVGIVANIYHKHTTGSWLLFERKKESYDIQENLHGIQKISESAMQVNLYLSA
ncbi:hypothetical protein AVI51_08565 [Piscirickettsia salmonis]|uniref:Uncharacterized protein n=2 Tax=Piscirickettsia salmonis TaxID=1238 RepID=A0A9Q5YHV9_PISSA|nr:hypothetical protein [Piscirickettsia salmonis]ALA23881.1 polypeptide-transport-associated domain-containing protein ShlB-type [Piscirickettsia salmonis]APS44298.1 hypothetical protein AVI48_07960 [Piscirickettsia salmonis]APS47658.1 hypothetical protein AVI49_08570 [Piscirickettsia salmonis]APS50910.1 hypothetical protein AVI50_08660 [Piscirickettsia salmonis]APS54115.1 hypothetical protein AVI51_08565 [Piscirickettsia salmonis]